MSALTGMVSKFYPYAQKYLGFDKPAQIVYQSDRANSKDPLGKTAHYEPQTYTVTLYVDGRHPKDLLRSLAHELVHHTQNCRGDLAPEKMGETGDGYAQSNQHLRKMEQEAYASMVMRDWEDQHKSKRRKNLHETNYNYKEIITMSAHKRLVQNIVAEIMKGATISEEEEDEDVKEEGQGDRNDDDREQGRKSSDRRQGASSSGSPGQNLEEDIINAIRQVMAEDGNAGKMDRKDVANKATGRWLKEADDEDEDSVEEGKYKRDDDEKKGNPFAKKGEEEEEKNEGWDRPKAATGSGPSAKAGKWDRSDVANKVPKGFVNEEDEDDGEPIEEADEEETTDDLKETFNRRNAHLYERLVKRWAQ